MCVVIDYDGSALSGHPCPSFYSQGGWVLHGNIRVGYISAKPGLYLYLPYLQTSVIITILGDKFASQSSGYFLHRTFPSISNRGRVAPDPTSGSLVRTLWYPRIISLTAAPKYSAE